MCAGCPSQGTGAGHALPTFSRAYAHTWKFVCSIVMLTTSSLREHHHSQQTMVRGAGAGLCWVYHPLQTDATHLPLNVVEDPGSYGQLGGTPPPNPRARFVTHLHGAHTHLTGGSAVLHLREGRDWSWGFHRAGGSSKVGQPFRRTIRGEVR